MVFSSLPTKAAGSSMPQCAVIGWPGQTGQTSAAALSQTVNTKSSSGASGLVNSSQLFERNPSVLKFSCCSSRSATGLTRPVGWLPAEYAWKRPLPRRLRRTRP